jgi:hypothetical protein
MALRGTAAGTIAPMNDKSTGRQSAWRFSLRELFLLILVAAAFLGWGMSLIPNYFWRFQPTSFFRGGELMRIDAAEWEADIKEICTELGEAVPQRMSITITTNDGSTGARQAMYFRFACPPDKRAAFADALTARMKERLKAAGCTPGSQANGHRINETRTMTYQRGPLGGACDICVTEGPEGKTCLIVNMCEMKGRFSHSGVSVPQIAD